MSKDAFADRLTAPHGGKLVELLVDTDRAAELKGVSRDWPSWDLTPRQRCDLELLVTGAFSPLTGFMTRADYEAVCGSMRLTDGTLWPIPITLDVSEDFAARLATMPTIALRDSEGVLLATLSVDDVWRPDRRTEAHAVYGTTSRDHAGVAHVLDHRHPILIAGRLAGVALPIHYDFRPLRLTPRALREEFQRLGWRRVVGFHTRSPLHRTHHALTRSAALSAEANLLIHPVAGTTEPDDIDHYTRIRCYQAILDRYPPHTVKLALLPLATRVAGPREALWHAIIRKNHGCTHFIVGPDHASPEPDVAGRSFYEPYAAQDLLRRHEQELGVRMVPSGEMVYVEDQEAYVVQDEIASGARALSISPTDLRRRLATGKELPPWFTFPEVECELRRRYQPRYRQGFTVFFTGLSGAGKSTIAQILQVKLLEAGGRPVTLLDGDLVRKHLSSELGFSKEHRDINIRRIGFVAAEITKNGGIALCAPIAPYESVRREVRAMIEPWGGFVLVHVATPLPVCEQRDRKGLYAKARVGIIEQFTGISDPYERPSGADVVVDTTDLTAEEAAQDVLLHLEREGYVGTA